MLIAKTIVFLANDVQNLKSAFFQLGTFKCEKSFFKLTRASLHSLITMIFSPHFYQVKKSYKTTVIIGKIL